MSARPVCEVIGMFASVAGAPDRVIGQLDDGRFVLLEQRRPNETMRQCGPAVSSDEAVEAAMNVLGGDRLVLTAPHTLLTVCLGLVGGVLLKRRRALEAENPALAEPGDPT